MPTSLLRVLPPFAAGYFFSCLLRNANAVLSPELVHELQLNAGQLGLLTSAYFFAFAASQVPLGILLDRYGAKRVESVLLLFAAAGAVVFAMGHSITTLTVGRALIGFGTSACFMAALKFFSHTYPAERQSSLSAAIAMSCGFGSLAASAPLEALLPFFGWRGLFFAFAGIIVVAAIYLFTVIPEMKPDAQDRTTFREQWDGIGYVLRSRQFWRYVPVNVFFNGGFMSIVGLWAIPWLMSVEGLNRETAARYLFATGFAMLAGNFTMAMASTWLIRRGVTLPSLIANGFAVMLLSFLAIEIGIQPTLPFWILFGFSASVIIPTFIAVGVSFPTQLAGRVVTMLNLMAFVGAFLIQWLAGVLMDVFMGMGWAAGNALRGAMAFLIAFQIIAWLRFVWENRRTASHANAA